MMELTIEHLSKRYGQHWALRELSWGWLDPTVLARRP